MKVLELVFWSHGKAFSVDHLREPSGKRCATNVAVYLSFTALTEFMLKNKTPVLIKLREKDA